MNINDFNYDLPKELIAQSPLRKRSSSRLMVLQEDKIEHKHFYDIIDYLKEGDVLVVNNSKVIKAKLIGRQETSGKVELLLENNNWCLIKGKNIHKGMYLFFDKQIIGVVEDKKENKFKIKFNKDVKEVLDEIGELPTPPYVKKRINSDDEYQTVYAEKEGSIAAPTAGFHFDEGLLKKIKEKWVKIAEITLHVSFSTFLPIKEEDYTKHKMYNEYYEIDEKNAEIINNAKRIFAVGTTTIRALESSVKNNKVIPGKSGTDIFIYPGYKFKLKYNGMLTNFHLPKSTLLLLVSAFYGKERILNAYNEAIKKKYRFYSFGDAMLLLNSHPQ